MLRTILLTCVVVWTCAVVLVNQVRTRAAVKANIVTRRCDAVIDVVLAEITGVTSLAGAAVQINTELFITSFK